MFDNPNEIRHHERQLTTLQQIGSTAEYTTQFRLSQSFVSWNDDALASAFRSGLSAAVKDALVHQHPYPKSLNELVNAVHRIDARLVERAREREVPSIRILTRNPTKSPPSKSTNYSSLEWPGGPLGTWTPISSPPKPFLFSNSVPFIH